MTSQTLEIATDYVSLDEPAYSLREVNLPTPDAKAVRRYQIIRVVRGGSLATFQRDLGDASMCDALQFAIPGGTVEDGKARHFDEGELTKEHTVGKLMEMADSLREDKSKETDYPSPDWQRLYHEEKERRKHLRRTQHAKGWA